VIAIWSSVRGMTGMMTALNIAYAQPERRGFIRFNATALVLTVVVIVGGLIALALVAGLPVVLNGAGTRGPGRWVGLVVEWPLLIVFVMAIVALIEAPFLFWRFIERLFAITVSIENAVSFPFSLLARKSQDFAALTRRRRFRSSFSAWDSFFSAIAQHSEYVNIAPSVIFGRIFAMNGNRV
jgi:hypothetical protein